MPVPTVVKLVSEAHSAKALVDVLMMPLPEASPQPTIVFEFVLVMTDTVAEVDAKEVVGPVMIVSVG